LHLKVTAGSKGVERFAKDGDRRAHTEGHQTAVDKVEWLGIDPFVVQIVDLEREVGGDAATVLVVESLER
jgi:hypothetical protein